MESLLCFFHFHFDFRVEECSFPLLQEEASSLRNAEQAGPSPLTALEAAALPSPASQVLDPKEEDPKRETADEE